jgi:hypothetical protein
MLLAYLEFFLSQAWSISVSPKNSGHWKCSWLRGVTAFRTSQKTEIEMNTYVYVWNMYANCWKHMEFSVCILIKTRTYTNISVLIQHISSHEFRSDIIQSIKKLIWKQKFIFILGITITYIWKNSLFKSKNICNNVIILCFTTIKHFIKYSRQN